LKSQTDIYNRPLFTINPKQISIQTMHLFTSHAGTFLGFVTFCLTNHHVKSECASLCPDGSPLPDAEKVIPDSKGLMCGQFEEMTLSLLDNYECEAAQLATGVFQCDCPIPVDPDAFCQLCADGSIPAAVETSNEEKRTECIGFMLAANKQTDHAKCKDLQASAGLVCGCHHTPPSDSLCPICFDGSDPVALEDKFIPGDVTGGKETPCMEVSRFMKTVPEGTDGCNQMQAITSAYCGCPNLPNTCAMCSENGLPTNLDTLVSDPETGHTFTCAQLFDLAPTQTAGSPDCLNIQNVGAVQCGCPETKIS
jgi:hypothetical protein